MKSVVDIVEKSKPYFSKYVYLVFNLFVYKTSCYSLILIKLIASRQEAVWSFRLGDTRKIANLYVARYLET